MRRRWQLQALGGGGGGVGHLAVAAGPGPGDAVVVLPLVGGDHHVAVGGGPLDVLAGVAARAGALVVAPETMADVSILCPKMA